MRACPPLTAPSPATPAPAIPAIATPSPSTSSLVDAGERTTVTVETSAFDERTSEFGCSPHGCTAENTRDNNLDVSSRWSCKGDLVGGEGGCCIEYVFEEPQDIVSLGIAFYKGTERPRTLNVYNNGNLYDQVVSSGSSDGLQEFALGSDDTADLMLCLDLSDYNGGDWLSITEVRLEKFQNHCICFVYNSTPHARAHFDTGSTLWSKLLSVRSPLKRLTAR